MDPLSVTASLIAVIQITSVVSTHCMQYVKSAKNTKSLILKLVQELGGLEIVLKTLEQLANRSSSPVTDGDDDSEDTSYLLPTLQKLVQLEYVFEECLRKLEQLEKDIAPSREVNLSKKEAFFRALHWPLKEAYMRNILDDINHYIALFSLALTVDEADHILDIRVKTDETHSMVKILHSHKEEESRRQLGDRIVKWLGAPDASADYMHAHKLRTKNTGTWLVESEEYKEWKQKPGSLVWVYGIAGCGKTILSSTIVEDLLTTSEADMNVAVAYFYFKADDKDKSNSSGMLRSLLKQLFDRGKRASDVFTDFLGDENQQPTSNQLLSSLSNISLEFRDVYIMLDALDECQDLEDLFDIIEDVDKWTDSRIHLIFTSRETKNIKEVVEGLTMTKSSIRLSALVVKRDIQMYIRDRLRTDRNFKRWRSHPEVQREIEDSMVEKSDGMFQWVMHQLVSLVECRRPQELRQALKTMPKGLNNTYAQILSRISEKDYDIAMRILHWMLFSNRPLYVDELAELAAMDLDAEPFEDIERLWEPTDVLNICPNLLTTVEETTHDNEDEPRLRVRLAHISIREYLLSSDILKGKASRFHITEPSARATITECCLMYLRLIKDTVPEAAKTLPLSLYATENWLYHYRKVPEAFTKTHKLVLDFFLHQKDPYLRWITYLSSAMPPYFNPGLMSSTPLSPLEVVSTYHLVTVLQMMLESDEIDTKSEAVLKKALRAAYLHGPMPGDKVATTRILIRHGADFTGDAKFATTLHAASYYGFDEIVRAELDEGTDVNQICGVYATALQAAVVGRHDRHSSEMRGHRWPSGSSRPGYVLEQKPPTTVELLLQRGADPKICGGENGSSLLAACYCGDMPCVKLLLAHGADPNYSNASSKGSCLAAACHSGDIRIVQLLFEHGADPNYGNASSKSNCLAAACESGDIRIVQLLFDHGAVSTSPMALYAATRISNSEIMRLLLEKGADPKLKGPNDETVLQIACSYWADPETVEILLQYGAEWEVGGGRFGFPLQNTCATYGAVEKLKILIAKGADVNQKGGAFGTALHAAAFYGDHEMVEYLIEQGADIHARGALFPSVMRHAIQNGHTEIFITLFKKGADMKTPSGRYGETLRETLATAPADKSEIWIRTGVSNNPKFPSSYLCVMIKKGNTWQDIDHIVLDDKGPQYKTDSSQWDCLLTEEC